MVCIVFFHYHINDWFGVLYCFPFIETSSLNIFWIENGKLRLSLPRYDLPAPQFSDVSIYPACRTSKMFNVNTCSHQFEAVGDIQIRRGDEQCSQVLICRLCKLKRIK